MQVEIPQVGRNLRNEDVSLSKRRLLKIGFALATLGPKVLIDMGVAYADALDSPADPPEPLAPGSAKQRIEETYGVKIGKWSDYHDPKGEDCILDSHANGVLVDQFNQCKDVPLELNESRIAIVERTFQALPRYWYEGAVLVPSIDPLKSFVTFEDPNIVNLLLRDFKSENPGAPLLGAHELGHRMTFKTIQDIVWEQQPMPDGRTKNVAVSAKCDEFDQIYEIFGGSYKQPPEYLIQIGNQVRQELEEDPSLVKENGGFNSVRAGIRYFAFKERFPVEVGPVLVEGILRPIFDPAASKDYFMRNYIAFFGEEIAGKLYEHAINYFFKDQPPS